jgi:hypothetical protein
MNLAWHKSGWGAVALVALLPTGSSSAAQGPAGMIASGSLTIRMTIRAPTRVTGIADIAFDDADAAAPHDMCLSGAVHTYTVAASGSGPDGALTVSSGDESIAYHLEWRSRTGATADEALSGDAPVTIKAVANPADCVRALESRQLSIVLDSADSEKLKAGTPYSGALTLMLAPE